MASKMAAIHGAESPLVPGVFSFGLWYTSLGNTRESVRRGRMGLGPHFLQLLSGCHCFDFVFPTRKQPEQLEREAAFYVAGYGSVLLGEGAFELFRLELRGRNHLRQHAECSQKK